MAKFHDVNRATTTNGGSEVTYRLKEVLKAAGWTVPRSSDGTTYNAAGDQITTPNTGAGGMNNNSAWFVIREPGGVREWCFQRGTANGQLRLKYSALDRFTGGSPAATVTPTATDQQVLTGGGTDGSPTYTSFFGTAGTYRSHCIAQSTAEGGAYGFWCLTSPNAGGTPTTGMYQEPMLVGSYPNTDPDPVIVNAGNSSAVWSINSTPVPKGWYAMNTGSEAWVDYPHAAPVNAGAATGTLYGVGQTGTSPYSGNDEAMAPTYARPTGSSQPGRKGTAKYLLMKGVNRDYPDTGNLTTDAYVYGNQLLIPWPENIVPAT